MGIHVGNRSARVVLAGALFLAGCASPMYIQYVPLATPPAPPRATLALKVIDQRPADQGGENKKQVGQVRGSFGIPHGMEDAKEDVAPRTIWDATTDALSHAGVTLQDGSGKTLVGVLRAYWMDGFMGYKANITVHYELKDAAGKALWTSNVDSGAGGTTFGKDPQDMTKAMFERALDELATRAGEQFGSAAFQQALQAP